MYLELETYLRVQEETFTEYNNLAVDKEKEKVLVDSDTIEAMLEDLITELGVMKEKYQDLKEDLENNYEPKKVDYYEEYGLNRSDF